MSFKATGSGPSLPWRPPSEQPAHFVDASIFGASAGNSRGANTKAIQDAINASIEHNVPLRWSEIYPVNEGLAWNAPTANIFGVGASKSGLSVVNSQSITKPVLTVGDGTGPSGSGFFNSSSLRDFGIYGDIAASDVTPWSSTLSGATLTNYNAGLLLNGVLNCRVENVYVRKTPIGFNMANNCYSSSFSHCKTFSGECYVPLYLSDNVSFGAGNDMFFANNWFTGLLCAVWIGASGGGYHFFGGQLGAGNGNGSVGADLLGVIVASAKLEDPTVIGDVYNVNFFGVSFEGPNNVWLYRNLYPGSRFSMHGCGFLSDNRSLGIFKSGSGAQNYGYNEMGSFHGNTFGGSAGVWASTYPIVMGDGGQPGGNSSFFEEGTHGFASGFSGISSGANTDMSTVGIVRGSRLTSGCGFNTTELLLPNGLILKRVGNALQQSIDWTNFTAIP